MGIYYTEHNRKQHRQKQQQQQQQSSSSRRISSSRIGFGWLFIILGVKCCNAFTAQPQSRPCQGGRRSSIHRFKCDSLDNIVRNMNSNINNVMLLAFSSLDNNSSTSKEDEEEKKMLSAPPTTKSNDNDFYAASSSTAPCTIKVIGVGGGGGNAVNRMIDIPTGSAGSNNYIEYWAINTDAQALSNSLAPNVLNIGVSSTRGLGAGGEPSVGKQAAVENRKEIQSICDNTDMVFITAGMGGGTGSGAAPIVAEIAKDDCDCLTVGIVTTPFAFEGRNRRKQAQQSIMELRQHVDTLIVVSNDKLLQIIPDNTPVTDAFSVADDVLRQGVIGISEIILKAGLVNVDFADVRSVMKDAGTALMGIGQAEGKNRATDAAIQAISSPLLDYPINKAKRIVFNIVGGPNMGLKEINEASQVIYDNADIDNANIIFGALIDPNMGDTISITVLACDFETSSDNFNDVDNMIFNNNKNNNNGAITDDDDSSNDDDNDDDKIEDDDDIDEGITLQQQQTNNNDNKKKRGRFGFLRRILKRRRQK